MNEAAIVWFRQDLRLTDNPALSAALARHEHVIPVYLHADDAKTEWSHGAASRWWLHHSLESLDASLRKLGSRLIIRCNGSSADLLGQLVEETGATHVYWNRLYEPHHIERDRIIKKRLLEQALEVSSFNGALLFEPWEITKADGSPFRVFTPFWKACVKKGLPAAHFDPPGQLPAVSRRTRSEKAASLDLLPKIRWDEGFTGNWLPGEAGAHEYLDEFLEDRVLHYKDDRDRPDRPGTSRLSPHLHFGEISPRQIVGVSNQAVDASSQRGIVGGTEAFIREVGWREFAYHLLYHFPHTVDKPLYDRFDAFPWEKNYARKLEAWQQGRTGIPIVDAGMRELWHTGWMHNRVRMIVASLLTKNMLIPWQEGARWFMGTLVDADLASNTLGWQWVAGCGADAAPYFRIFNPVTQAQKFDPEGGYIRKWVPEIAALPDKYLAKPWTTPPDLLDAHKLKLGKDYPEPVVDLKASRERALERYQSLKRMQ